MMNSVNTPQARCRAGVARRDITPPVGIYHRMWGAATHDRATGVHRPLVATALVLESLDAASPRRQVIVAIDHCLMWADEVRDLRSTVCRETDITDDELHVAFSHTHAAGLMDRGRKELPGGELVGPYLDRLATLIAEAVHEAKRELKVASIVYGIGHSDLAAHRDAWDEQSQQFVCGYNPAGPADDTIHIARIDMEAGNTIAVVVNYACHPTTLAWKNTLISPDYVGAMRQIVEEKCGGLCIFLQGASGDLGPREGYVGDAAVADRNGRQLGYAVLSALESMPKAGTQFTYAGPVVSGATLGTWKHMPLADDAVRDLAGWQWRRWTVDLPYRANLPNAEETKAELDRWRNAEVAAHRDDDRLAARDCRAQIERMKRQLTRTTQLPAGSTFPLPITLGRVGDGYWLLLEGEYYQALQLALRARFAGTPIVVASVVDGWRPAYLPTRETYGLGIYQEQVAVLAPGCLEAVIEAVSVEIDDWQATR